MQALHFNSQTTCPGQGSNRDNHLVRRRAERGDRRRLVFHVGGLAELDGDEGEVIDVVLPLLPAQASIRA